VEHIMVSWTYFLGYNKIDVVHDIVQSDMDQDADVTNNRLKATQKKLGFLNKNSGQGWSLMTMCILMVVIVVLVLVLFKLL
jgi:SYP5 family syntaxin